jgi:indoleamine 2,3-dioxygenase
MPSNEMTSILKDFRSYRPADHNKWLQFVEKNANSVGIEKFARADPTSLTLYIQLLDQVRDFRNRHWSFAKEYIIKRTAYPKATGGSPMATVRLYIC